MKRLVPLLVVLSLMTSPVATAAEDGGETGTAVPDCEDVFDDDLCAFLDKSCKDVLDDDLCNFASGGCKAILDDELCDEYFDAVATVDRADGGPSLCKLIFDDDLCNAIQGTCEEVFDDAICERLNVDTLIDEI